METLHVSVVHLELVPFSVSLPSRVVSPSFSVTLQICGGCFRSQSADEEIAKSFLFHSQSTRGFVLKRNFSVLFLWSPERTITHLQRAPAGMSLGHAGPRMGLVTAAAKGRHGLLCHITSGVYSLNLETFATVLSLHSVKYCHV